jgi:hypothetical protein
MNINAYRNKMAYPKKADFVDMSTGDLAEYRKAIGAYNAETDRLKALFQVDLEADNDMVGHPKAELLFTKAWDMGHAAGYHEVKGYYEDLLELVK